MHGIWSWISAENRKIIVEFAKNFLKQGGIFYNSYNSFPGWAANSPMREVFAMYDKYAHKSDNTYNRVEEAIKFTEELFKANPAYVQQVPSVKAALERVRKDDHTYLAHEYFNEHWVGMYFTEVLEMLQDAKLEFACSAVLLDFFEHLILPQSALEFLNKIENPIMREQTRDYFVNQQFRKDFYLRGARRISPAERARRLFETKFVLMRKELPRSFQKVTFNEELCKKLNEYLASEDYAPKNLMQFARENPQIEPNHIIEHMIIFAHMGAVAPCQSDAATRQVASRCGALNDYICSRSKWTSENMFLASPVTGMGVQIDRLSQIFILAYRGGKKSKTELAREMWEIFSSQGQSFVSGGKALQTVEENIAECERMAQNFLDNAPLLRALQII